MNRNCRVPLLCTVYHSHHVVIGRFVVSMI